MWDYETLLHRLEAELLRLYPHQILDERHPDYGAFVHPGYGFAVADHCTGGNTLALACAVYLADDSVLAGNAELLRRIEAAMRFQRKAQRPSGLIDLPSVDINSPPDTAFMVQLLCPLCTLARRKAEGGDVGARTIAEGLGGFIETAGRGLIGTGFRTPNHRWVVCSALAQAMSLFPAMDGRAYVESILAETIDINADGEYSERSTGVYSAVCNRSLRYMADGLGKAELLDHVRANLDFMAALMNPDGSVVTAISRRQDHGMKVVPVLMADSFLDMAVRDGNGLWAEIADRLAASSAAADGLWLLLLLLDHPAYRTRKLARRPAADSADRVFPASRFWRVQRGEMTAIAAAGNAAAFSLTHGDIALQAVRIRGSFFAIGPFEAHEMHAILDGVQLVSLKERRNKAYWDLPLGRPVVFDNPHVGYYPLADNGPQRVRKRWQMEDTDVVLDIREVSGGFDLRVNTPGGYDHIPFVIEFCFQVGGLLETTGLVHRPHVGDRMLLRRGTAIYHTERYGIEVTAGGDAHRMFNLCAPAGGCFSLFAAHLSPLDEAIRIRYGLWSEATRELQ
jgi:hypothetical protein